MKSGYKMINIACERKCDDVRQQECTCMHCLYTVSTENTIKFLVFYCHQVAAKGFTPLKQSLSGLLQVHFHVYLYLSIMFSLFQPISILIRSWAGVRKPLRSALWRRDIWTASLCTREPRDSNSCVSGTTR